MVILSIYLLGMFVCAYFLGRFDYGEYSGALILWPVMIIVIPFMLLLVKVIELGEDHA